MKYSKSTEEMMEKKKANKTIAKWNKVIGRAWNMFDLQPTEIISNCLQWMTEMGTATKYRDMMLRITKKYRANFYDLIIKSRKNSFKQKYVSGLG